MKPTMGIREPTQPTIYEFGLRIRDLTSQNGIQQQQFCNPIPVHMGSKWSQVSVNHCESPAQVLVCLKLEKESWSMVIFHERYIHIYIYYIIYIM